ncbi:MAG: VWA domain-containing protein, partial [Marinovum sp.]|nr:VWA domain-containing protein [Marinovum sp.]
MINNLLISQTVGSDLSLDGAENVTSLVANGRTYLYVTSNYSNALNVFEVFADGTVGLVSTFDNNTSSTFISGASAVNATVINGSIYVYLGGRFDNTLRVLSQDATTGALSEIQTIADTDNTSYQLDSLSGSLPIAVVGGNRFIVVEGGDDDGLSVFQIGTNGLLTNVANVDDVNNASFGLNNVVDSTIAQIGGNTYVFAVGDFDDAITTFQLTSTGQLNFVESIFDGSLQELNGAHAVDTLVIGGVTYLFVAGRNDYGVSVYSVDSAGAATNVFNLTDTTGIELSGAREVEAFTFNGTNYLMVTGEYDDGVTLFEVGSDGSLTARTSILDDNAAQIFLDGAAGAQFVEVAGQGFVAVTALYDDRLTIMQVDPSTDPIEGADGPDVLVGTQAGDTINGLRQNDIILGEDGDDNLNGNGGSDVINGGNGDDSISGDGALTQTASDVVTVTETGQDIALTVTLPDTNAGSSIDISGLIARQPQDTAEFNIVYVIDVSGSMGDQFIGSETVGDLNGDFASNTLIDGTISAFQSLNASIVSAGFGTSDVSIVAFDDTAATVFSGSALTGVDQALVSLDSSGGTNFDVALQQAITELNNSGSGENVVYFLSDGENGGGSASFADEVATLTNPNGLNATINSIGLGSDSDLTQLDLLDDGIANNSAAQVLTPSTLTASLVGSPVASSEIDRMEIYVNGTLRRTLDDTQFAITPLGLQYNVSVSGLSTNAGDVIEVILIASDTAATQVAVSLTVPNAEPDFGNDVLIGGNGNDQIQGNAGNDTLFGDDGDDALIGGAGNDFIAGAGGNDGLFGGTGNDTMVSGAGADTLIGGIGNDVYHVDRFDTVDESSGLASDFDTLVSRLTIDLRDAVWNGDFEAVRLIGTADVDALGTSAANRLEGNVGDNEIFGFEGNDTLWGGLGNDTLYGGDQYDTLRGGEGNDVVYGGNGQDQAFLEQGADVFNDNTQNDANGHDTVFGGLGN